jgi:hypothetical protein
MPGSAVNRMRDGLIEGVEHFELPKRVNLRSAPGTSLAVAVRPQSFQ